MSQTAILDVFVELPDFRRRAADFSRDLFRFSGDRQISILQA